jgi:hypothetical protein
MLPKDQPRPELTGGSDLAGFPLLLVPLEPAFRAIGVRRTKGYALIAAGDLTMVKIGGKSLITADSLRRFAATLPSVRTRARG